MAEVTATVIDDYLAFWHPLLDDQIDEDYLDWGTIAAASSADRVVRVKNCSADYWAVAVTVTVADQGSGAGRSIAAQHLLSSDNDTFTPTLDLADLAPGAISEPFTLRRVTDPDADTGPGAFQLLAAAGDWS